ncbi:hypothetical protein N005_24925 [Pseudomonas mediterranea CFBP 5447]|nr:hypothetical protein N005_24925 [Pseudomonas mediterranea CFBP 5447]
MATLTLTDRNHCYDQHLVYHTIDESIACIAQLDFIGATQPMQTVSLDMRIKQSLFELLFELLS